MRVTVAEPQARSREAQGERSGRQTHDHRKTNRQRGRVRAASVLATTKPEAHQDAPGRAGWRVGKVQALTRGELLVERQGEVSRGRSSGDACPKAGRAKGQSIKEHGSTKSHPARRETPGTHGAATTAASVDRHHAVGTVQPGWTAWGEAESSWVSGGDRKP